MMMIVMMSTIMVIEYDDDDDNENLTMQELLMRIRNGLVGSMFTG